MDSLYTEKVQRLIYAAKDRLPGDFPLVTVEREIYGSMKHDAIIIQVYPEDYDWRTVEGRAQIMTVLLELRGLIREEGVPCLIERPETAQG